MTATTTNLGSVLQLTLQQGRDADFTEGYEFAAVHEMATVNIGPSISLPCVC